MSRSRLPSLIIVTPGPLDALKVEKLTAVMQLGPSVGIQLRHPEASTRVLLEEARALQTLCVRSRVPLFINGRLDIALLVEAHLHLPSRNLTPTDVRSHLPARRWISVAVHDDHEAQASAGADFALVSPVFAPLSKLQTREALGASGFRALSAKLSCPAYALGGVAPGNAHPLGAAGLGVIGAVLEAEDPHAAALALLDCV